VTATRDADLYRQFLDDHDYWTPNRQNVAYRRMKQQLDRLIEACGGSVPDLDDESAEGTES
jgi:hypothetical protein